MLEPNPIREELHRVREEFAGKAGGDLHKMIAEARERALHSGRAIEIHDFFEANLAQPQASQYLPEHPVAGAPQTNG